MAQTALKMGSAKRIALVAHDNKKDDLMEWAEYNKGTLANHELCATGTTGRVLANELGLEINRVRSGPLGGDLQIGAKIAEGEIDTLVFFWGLLEAQPHDPDIRALLRLAVVWNIPAATNRATADFVLSSPLLAKKYERVVPDYDEHMGRMERRLGRAPGAGGSA